MSKKSRSVLGSATQAATLAEVQAAISTHAYLRPVDLKVDEKAQRTLNQTHVAKIAAEYDPDRFGMGTVSVRAKGFYVVDAQHRCEAAKMAGQGEQPVFFELRHGLTQRQEAVLFRELNAHKLKVSAIADFLTGVTAEDAVCVAIDKILHGFGLRVAANCGDGTVSAITAVTRLYRLDEGDGGVLLKRTLKIIVDTWGKEHDAYDNVLLRGVGALLRRYEDKVDDKRLVRTLRRSTDPSALIGRIKGFHVATRKSVEHSGLEVIRGLYNNRLTAASRLKSGDG